MRADRGLILALGVAAISGACASAGTGAGAGSVKSSELPQVACSSGNVVATPQATAAQGALDRTLVVKGEAAAPLYQQALQQAEAGIQADPNNPYHYYLAAQAQVGLGDYAAADTLFAKTVSVCPEFASEVNPLRQQAWGKIFQAGLDTFNAGDTATAIAKWEQAANFYSGAPNANFNLAVVYTQQGNYEKALENYRRTLAILDSIPPDTAAAVVQERAETRANTLAGLLSAGAQLFQANKYAQAADVFQLLTKDNPNSRDAWYNYALSLYKQEKWQDLVPVAKKVVEIDPLNYNARIILFNAYKGLSEAAKAAGNAAAEKPNRDQALATLEAADKLPVHVDAVQIANAEGGTKVSGTVTGANAAAGTPVTLNFTLYGPDGQVGTGTTTVTAPAKDATTNFEFTVNTTAPPTGYSYTFR